MSGHRLLLALAAVLILVALLYLTVGQGSGAGGGQATLPEGGGDADPVIGAAAQNQPADLGTTRPQETVRSAARASDGYGVVVDSNGSPVGGARVWFGEEGRPGASSDAGGRFAIPERLAAAGSARLAVYAEDYLPYESEHDLRGGVEIRMQRGGVLDLQLVGATGEDLHVQASLTLRCGNARREVITRGDGSLRTSGWGYQPVMVSWSDTPVGVSEPLTAEEPVRMLVSLPRLQEGTVAGRVEFQGAPVAGATVHRRKDVLDTQPVVTDEEGRFTIPILAGKRVVLVAEAPGMAPAAHRLDERHLSGEEVVLQLGTAREIPGRVLTQYGEQPLADARVLITMRIPLQGEDTTELGRLPSFTWVREAVTDVAGQFASGGLPADGRVHFRAELGERRSEQETRDGVDVTEVVLFMNLGVELVGRVTDASGRPVSDAILCLRRKYLQHKVGYSRNRWPADAEGRFRIQVPGRFGSSFFLAASAPGCVPEGVPVENAVPGPPIEVNVVLRRGTAGRITGRVTDAEGNPVHKVRVKARPAGRKITWGTRTDPFGRFRMRTLVPGSYQLFVDDPPEGMEPKEISVSTDTDGLQLTLKGPRLMQGRLEPPPGWDGSTDASGLVVWDEQERFFWVNSDDGSFRFDAPPAGTQYRILVDPLELAPVLAGPFVAPEDLDSEEIVIRLQEGFRIEGDVLPPAGFELRTGSLRVIASYQIPGLATSTRAWNLRSEIEGPGLFAIPQAPFASTVTITVHALDADGGKLNGSAEVEVQGDRAVQIELMESRPDPSAERMEQFELDLQEMTEETGYLGDER